MPASATSSICIRQWQTAWALLNVVLFIGVIGGSASAVSKPPWIELRSPHFVVVTNAGEGRARQTAYQFEMFRAVIRAYFGQKEESAEQPVTILAAKDERTLRGLLPEYWAQKGSAHPDGVYLSGGDADYIGLRLDVGLEQDTFEPFEPVYHEYVHYVTRKLIISMPLWMVEGLAEFYGNVRIRNKEVFIGAPSTTDLMILHQQQLLPVSTLFAVDASSPYYHEQNKTSIFYAESWALTHYLFARDWNEHTQRMTEFVRQLSEGVDPKEAAVRTIGDANGLEGALRKYLNNLSFSAMKVEPPSIDEKGFRMRPMTDTEALAVRADFMAHDYHFAEARQMLEEVVKADPKLTIAYDGLSSLALQQGNTDEAEKWSSQGLALDPQDYRANYYYAWSLLKGGHTEEASLVKAEASVRVVLKGNPEFVPAYDAMAYVLALEGGKEKLDEAYMMTLQAVSHEPGNVQYRIRTVEVLERQRRPEDAVRVATLAASMAKTPEEQKAAAATLAGAQQFQESWEKFKASQAAAGGEVHSVGVPPTVTRHVNVSFGVVILSSTQGVEFSSYLNREVMPKLQREWEAHIQSVSTEVAEKEGKVIIEFVIYRDGSVADIKLKQSTQEQELDDAVRGAIQSASPFAPLPSKFRGKNIALRFQCEYNAGEHAGSTPAGQVAVSGSKNEVEEKSTKPPLTGVTTHRSTETPRASTAASPRSPHPNALRIAPSFADVVVGAKQQFASANLSAGKKVVWKVFGVGCSGASCGTITPDGLYTAPMKTPSPAAVTVTAAPADALSDTAFALVTILSSSSK